MLPDITRSYLGYEPVINVIREGEGEGRRTCRIFGYVIPHANSNLSIHPLDPRGDRVLPFLNLKRISLPLDVHLPFAHDATLARLSVGSDGRTKS